MKNPDLTIISVTYNSKQVISQFLKNISDDFNIIIADNASKDGTADFIKGNYIQVEVVELPQNTGYGRAANVALNKVTTDFCFLLNPDIIADTGEILKLLEQAKQQPNLGVISPATSKDEFDASKTSPEKVTWVVGATMLFNMKNLKQIGFFDENIFLYYEETDLCKRMLKAGFDILICKNIYLEHLVGKSSAPNPKIEYLKYWHSGWSKLYFNKKYLAKNEYLKKTFSQTFMYLLKFIIYSLMLNNKKTKYKARLAGSIAFLIGKKAFDENGNPRGITI